MTGLRVLGDESRKRYADPLLTTLTILLVLLMFVVAPLQIERGIGATEFGAAIALMMIGGVRMLTRLLLPPLLMLAAFCMNAVVIFHRLHGRPSLEDLYLSAFAWITLTVTLGWVVARSVFGPGRINYHRIIGAILLYLLIAMAFAALYLLIGLRVPGAFANLAFEDSPALTSTLIYFSCVTLTTVGYGDITPIYPLARSLANLEAIIGQLYPAILIGRLVTLQLERPD